MPKPVNAAALTSPHRIQRTAILGASLIAAALAGVGFVSPFALLSTLFDGVSALFVLVPPALAGLWFVPWFRLQELPIRWHILIGASLGLGVISLLVLILGLGGLLDRPIWIGIYAVLGVAGLLRLLAPARSGRRIGKGVCDESFFRAAPVRKRSQPHDNPLPYGRGSDQRAPTHTRSKNSASPARDEGSATDAAGLRLRSRDRFLLILTVPFLALAILASSNAPGLIRQEEGFAYDVLEYHLEMPKEYLEAGRIEYAPHNVYANFPSNVEMLYLLAMIFNGEATSAATTANFIHLLLAVLTVYAGWVAGRDWSPRSGLLAGLALGTCGWFVYLSGLAYVEHGMLLFAVAATGAMLRALRAAGGRTCSTGSATEPEVQVHCWTWVALSGALAGLSCGCKYTAVPMVALPLGLVAMMCPTRLRERLRCGLIFALVAVATFSPWLMKNLVMTGNPVFPLLNGYMGAAPPGWGADETRAWDAGHQPAENERDLARRAATWWQHVAADPYQRFGPALLVVPLLGLFGRKRDRIDAALLGVLAVQLAVWLLATHLYARFAVVMLVPLALLLGRSVLGCASSPAWRVALVVFAVCLGGIWNLAYAFNLHRQERALGGPPSLIFEGKIPGYEYFGVVNHELPENAKLLVVGDAKAFFFKRDVDYCVVFNRNPFVEIVREAGDDAAIVAWLRAQGYTHVLVNWSEVRRLSTSYGFPQEITPGLFRRLEQQGLALFRRFDHPSNDLPYVDLWTVRRANGPAAS